MAHLIVLSEAFSCAVHVYSMMTQSFASIRIATSLGLSISPYGFLYGLVVLCFHGKTSL